MVKAIWATLFVNLPSLSAMANTKLLRDTNLFGNRAAPTRSGTFSKKDPSGLGVGLRVKI